MQTTEEQETKLDFDPVIKHVGSKPYAYCHNTTCRFEGKNPRTKEVLSANRHAIDCPNCVHVLHWVRR